jgi:hypothetical protein
MPYLMSDDGFPEHPKVDALSDGAYRLHDAGRHYAAKNLTDGNMPARKVARLTPHYKASHLAELLDSGVWHRGGEGCSTEHCVKGEPGDYVVHDYLQWNKPAAWWEEKRRAEAERQAEWRRKQAEKKAREKAVVRRA